jgi:hypothetical protein
MGSTLVDSGNQQSHAVWPLAVDLGVDLSLLTNHIDERAEGHGAAVGQAVAETLLLHEVGQDTGIGCETGNGDTGMFVDGKELLLV